MDSLDTLNALLEMTEEAEQLSSEAEKSKRLRSLFTEIRQKAKDEHKRLKGNQRQKESPYQLCMIGILEECDLGRVSWQNVKDLDARLRRIHEEIDRTIKEIQAGRRIM